MSQQVTVSMMDNFFQPQTMTIAVGTTVLWTNPGINPHTSTTETGEWDSGIRTPGQTYSRTFNTPGTFAYVCTIHRALGMVGTVVVQAAAQPTATVAPPAPTPTAPPKPTAAPATPTPVPPPAQPTATPPTAKPTATPTPLVPVLPRTGDSSLPPWSLLFAGLVIVVGLAIRTATRG